MRKLLLALLSLVLTSGVGARVGDKNQYCTGSLPQPVALDNRIVTITTDGTANTEGAWNEVENAAPSRVDFLTVRPYTAVADSSFFCDIGYDPDGGANSVTVVVSNLATQGGTAGVLPARYNMLPVVIPSGAQILTRCQSSGTSKAVNVLVTAFIGNRPNLSNPVTYGATDATTLGINVDPGASINTKGSYADITATTTEPAFQVWMYIGGNGDYAIAGGNAYYVDLAQGASNTLIIRDIRFIKNVSGDAPDEQGFGPFAVTIPNGVAISARAEDTANTDGDRDLDVIVYASKEKYGSPCM